MNFKSICLITLSLIWTSTVIFAQSTMVQFDHKRSTFNEGNPLPAEEDMVFTGSISDNTSGVSLKIYPKKGEDESNAIFEGYWKEPEDEVSKNFRIPVDKKLRSSKKYDFRINYYRDVTNIERDKLEKDVLTNINAYLDQSFDVNKKKVKLVKKTKDTMKDLEIIVTESLGLYLNKSDVRFKGFSDLTLQKLKQLENASLKSGLGFMTSKDKKQAKADKYQTLLNDLKTQIKTEASYLFNLEWAVVYQARYVDNYPTENENGSIAIHVGYGAAFMDGVVDSLNYGHSPYVGLTIPLGNEAFASKFFQNTSVNFGIFLRDFSDGNGNKVTGPVIKKPIYVGLGYKVYRFININGGITLLENASTAGTIDGVGKRIYVRPFVGLSARFNLSLGLDK